MRFIQVYKSVHFKTARETDYSIYDGLITIEDSLEDNPLRINNDLCPQLVLCFDDISLPDDYIPPQKKHIERALEFAEEIEMVLLSSIALQELAGHQL